MSCDIKTTHDKSHSYTLNENIAVIHCIRSNGQVKLMNYGTDPLQNTAFYEKM